VFATRFLAGLPGFQPALLLPELVLVGPVIFAPGDQLSKVLFLALERLELIGILLLFP
jgi:hypothetical protein